MPRVFHVRRLAPSGGMIQGCFWSCSGADPARGLGCCEARSGLPRATCCPSPSWALGFNLAPGRELALAQAGSLWVPLARSGSRTYCGFSVGTPPWLSGFLAMGSPTFRFLAPPAPWLPARLAVWPSCSSVGSLGGAPLSCDLRLGDGCIVSLVSLRRPVVVPDVSPFQWQACCAAVVGATCRGVCHNTVHYRPQYITVDYSSTVQCHTQQYMQYTTVLVA